MTMLSEVTLSILHGQVLVHLAAHPSPGLLWADEHVAQGFAWSEGVVAFGVSDHDGECLLRVVEADDARPSDVALWAMQVPFDVAGPLMVGTVGLMHRVDVPLGAHALVFEALPGDADHALTLELRFARDDGTPFAILRRGGELETDALLRTDAELAG